MTKSRPQPSSSVVFGTSVLICCACVVAVAQPPAPLPPEAVEAFESATEQSLQEREAPRPAPQPPVPAEQIQEAFERGEEAVREQREAAPTPPTPTPEEIEKTKEAFEDAEAIKRDEEAVEAVVKGIFQASELQLPLAPETVLVTSHGDPFLTVQDFNQRVRSTRGSDLYEARRNAVDAIVRTRLQAMMAEDAGLAEKASVERRLAKAMEDQHPGAQVVDVDRFAVADAEARRYYEEHREDFRRPDLGTKARAAVRASESDARALLARIKSSPDDLALWLSAEPIRGEQLPGAVREALFHAEAGDITDVVETPVGYYVAQLVDRSPFDHFLVQVRTFPSEAAALEAKQASAAKGLFEGDEDGSPAPVSVEDLPAAVRAAVRHMKVGEISEPISAPLGVMLVKVTARWSEAPIERVAVFAVPSMAVGREAVERGAAPDDIEPRMVSESDLTEPLLEVARTLEQGEIGGPVQTDTGTFLLRVDERRRPEPYQTFAEAKETITRRLRSAKIASAEKQAYFDEHPEEFRLETPRYIVDVLVSGGADDGLDVLREVAAITDPAAQNSAFEAALSDRGFEVVAADDLPAALVGPISSLESGAVSDVATTGLGHFVFRLKTVEDPAFAKFDDVATDIGALLADRAEEALQLEAVLAERDREIAIEAAHDQVLRTAFRRDFVGQIDKVSDEEAEDWWRRNGAKMMAAFGAKPEAIKEVMADEERVPSMRMLKRNVLNGRMREAINERSRAEGIVVIEQLLNY